MQQIFKAVKYLQEGKRPLGVEIRILNNMITRFFELTPSHSEVERLTGTNGWIIRYIARNSDHDVFQRDLETEFGITRSTASRVVELMVQKGLIMRESVEYDARLKKLVLTDKAKELSFEMRRDGDRVEFMLTDGMSQEEIDNIYTTLYQMQDRISALISNQITENSERK